MDKAKIAGRKPLRVELTEGEKKSWCACGLNEEVAFCNGSHKTTDLTPLRFEAQKGGPAFLCMCKQTKNPPYCDGAHNNLPG